MEPEIGSSVITGMFAYGPFAVLFSWLLYYIMKENSKRETNYQAIIEKLTARFDVVDDVQKDVSEIRQFLIKGRHQDE